MRTAAILIPTLVLLLWSPLRSQGVDFISLDSYIGTALSDWEVPGLAIAVIKDDSVVFARGYGVKTLGEPGPVDTHTLFAITSLSKAFTVACLGILVDQGKLRWDDRVTDYVPSFQLYDPYATRELPCLGGDLTHWHYDTFRIELRDPTLPPGTVNFFLDTAGKVSEMVVHIPNPDFDFRELELKRLSDLSV